MPDRNEVGAVSHLRLALEELPGRQEADDVCRRSQAQRALNVLQQAMVGAHLECRLRRQQAHEVNVLPLRYAALRVER